MISGFLILGRAKIENVLIFPSISRSSLLDMEVQLPYTHILSLPKRVILDLRSLTRILELFYLVQ